MKVLIVRGKESPKSWKGYVACEKRNNHDKQGCGAVLEIEEGDLNLMYWEDNSSQHYYVAVRCPECGKPNEVKDVPRTILERMVEMLKHGKTLFDGYVSETQAAGVC